jgi:hypothetical protein
MQHLKAAVALGIVASALAFLSGCGGGDSTGAPGGTTDSTTAIPSKSKSNGGEPSAEFLGPGKNGKLAKQGKEVGAAEREAASKVLEESFVARAARDWAGQCATLSAFAAEGVEAEAGKSKGGCTANLESLGSQAPKAVLENPMIEPIAALRVEGTEAFAFFHGAGGQDYVMPMQKEGDEWKVGSLSPQETP